MNIGLLGALPEQIETSLDDGLARCASFNKRGNLLAVGCNDGRVVVWDFETKGIVKMLIGHVHPVTSVSWSRNSKLLLTSSTDWHLRLWDILSSNFEITVKFESPILHSQIHPRNKKECVVSALHEPACVIDLTTGAKTPLPRDPNFASEGEKNKHIAAPNSFAIYSKKGDKIYIGDAFGVVTIIRSEDLSILNTFRLDGEAPIKALCLSKDEKQLLVNCTDKVLRLYNLSDFSLAHELQDVITHLHWKKCCFSADGDYIVGGSAMKHEHRIYIWSRQYGQLVKILEGPKEGIMDLIWHPTKPIICSCSTSGPVYVWNTQDQEAWSAFAPGFVELEENEEYIEREDEFDIVDTDELERSKEKQRKLVEEQEDEEVDIMTIDRDGLSSDEEEELFFLPTFPIPDDQMEAPLSTTPPKETDATGARRKKKAPRGAPAAAAAIAAQTPKSRMSEEISVHSRLLSTPCLLPSTSVPTKSEHDNYLAALELLKLREKLDQLFQGINLEGKSREPSALSKYGTELSNLYMSHASVCPSCERGQKKADEYLEMLLAQLRKIESEMLDAAQLRDEATAELILTISQKEKELAEERRVRTEMENKIKSYEQYLIKATKTLQGIRAQIDTSQRQFAMHESSVMQLKLTHAKLTEVFSVQEEKLALLESVNKRIEDELNKCKNENEQLVDKLAAGGSKVLECEAQIRKEREEKAHLSLQLEKQAKALADLTMERNKLVELVDQAKEQLLANNTEISQLTAELAKLQAEKSQMLKEEVAKAPELPVQHVENESKNQAEIEELKQELQQRKSSEQVLQLKLDATEDLVVNLKLQCKQLEQTVEDLKKQLELSQSEQSRLTQELKTLKEKYERVSYSQVSTVPSAGPTRVVEQRNPEIRNIPTTTRSDEKRGPKVVDYTEFPDDDPFGIDSAELLAGTNAPMLHIDLEAETSVEKQTNSKPAKRTSNAQTQRQKPSPSSESKHLGSIIRQPAGTSQVPDYAQVLGAQPAGATYPSSSLVRRSPSTSAGNGACCGKQLFGVVVVCDICRKRFHAVCVKASPKLPFTCSTCSQHIFGDTAPPATASISLVKSKGRSANRAKKSAAK